jgi:hypothetical protein
LRACLLAFSWGSPLVVSGANRGSRNIFCKVLGAFTRVAAFLSGWLLLLFALSMTFTLGLKAPLNFSVFTASAGAFLLATKST